MIMTVLAVMIAMTMLMNEVLVQYQPHAQASIDEAFTRLVGQVTGILLKGCHAQTAPVVLPRCLLDFWYKTQDCVGEAEGIPRKVN